MTLKTIAIDTAVQIIIASNSHLDRQKCKPCNDNDEINKIINQTCTSSSTPSEPKNSKEHCDSDSSDSKPDSSLNSE